MDLRKQIIPKPTWTINGQAAFEQYHHNHLSSLQSAFYFFFLLFLPLLFSEFRLFWIVLVHSLMYSTVSFIIYSFSLFRCRFGFFLLLLFWLSLRMKNNYVEQTAKTARVAKRWRRRIIVYLNSGYRIDLIWFSRKEKLNSVSVLLTVER